MAIINLPDIHGCTFPITTKDIETMKECIVIKSNAPHRVGIVTELVCKDTGRRVLIDKTIKEIFQTIVDSAMDEFKKKCRY